MSTRSRGLTLIEVTISVAILVIVVAMTMTVVVEGLRIQRRGEQLADANDAARFAGESVVRAVEAAGFGMSNGLYVRTSGGPVQLTSPLIVLNSAAGPDELYVVRTFRSALLEACVDDGAYTTVQASGFGNILVRCPVTNGSGGAPTFLLATNMSTGALLSSPTFAPVSGGQTLSYAEAGTANFGPHPQRGFQKGDFVLPAIVERYYIGPWPVMRPGPTTTPSLLVEPGTIGTAAQGFVPTGNARLVQLDVEDLQLAAGIDATLSGNPASITFASQNVGPAYVTGLRSLRVNLVSRSPLPLRNTDNSIQQSPELAPMSVEDHPSAGVIDGYRRTLFSRRVELANLGAADL